MKNYILGSICLLFLFACGGAEDSSSDVKDSPPKVETSNNDAGNAFIKEFCLFVREYFFKNYITIFIIKISIVVMHDFSKCYLVNLL